MMVVRLMLSLPLNYHFDVELLYRKWYLYPIGGWIVIIPVFFFFT